MRPVSIRFLIFILLLTSIQRPSAAQTYYQISGAITIPETITWYWGNVILEEIASQNRFQKTITPAQPTFQLDNVPAGSYTFQSGIFGSDGILTCYHPNRLQGSCFGPQSDTIEISGNRSDLDMEFPDYGSVSIQLINQIGGNPIIIPWIQKPAIDCYHWLLFNNKDNATIKQLIGLEPDQYTAHLLLAHSLYHTDTLEFTEEIPIPPGGQTIRQWFITPEILDPYILIPPETTDLHATSITLNWSMNKPSICSLYYRQLFTTDWLSWEGNSAANRQEYRAEIENLLPNTFYQYKLSWWKETYYQIHDSIGSFKTVPPEYYLTEGPFVPFVTDRKALIQWETNKNCACSLYYYIKNSESGVFEWRSASGNNDTLRNFFQIELTDLNPFTIYFYYIRLYDGDHHFANETHHFNALLTLWSYTAKPFQLTGRPTPIYISDRQAIIYCGTDEPIKGICQVLKDGVARETYIRSIFYPWSLKRQLFIIDSLEPATPFQYRIGNWNGIDPPVFHADTFSATTRGESDRQAPLILNGPDLSILQNCALATFSTDEAARALLILYRAGQPIDSIYHSSYLTRHQFLLAGLDSITEYRYTIDLADRSGNQRHWSGEPALLNRHYRIPNSILSGYGGTNSFTTSNSADTRPPAFTIYPYPLAIMDSVTLFTFTTSEQTRWSVRVNNAANQTILWFESNNFDYEHTATLTRLNPRTDYEALFVITDLAENSDSVQGITHWRTTLKTPPQAAILTRPTEFFLTPEYALLQWESDIPLQGGLWLSLLPDLNPAFLITEAQLSRNHAMVVTNLNPSLKAPSKPSQFPMLRIRPDSGLHSNRNSFLATH